MNASLVNPSAVAREPWPEWAEKPGDLTRAQGLQAARPALFPALRQGGQLQVRGARWDEPPLSRAAATRAASRLRAGGLHAGSLQAPPPRPARGLRAEHCGPQGRPRSATRLGCWAESPHPTALRFGAAQPGAGALSSRHAYSLRLCEASRPGEGPVTEVSCGFLIDLSSEGSERA